jgi:hypothetical protein
VADAGTQGHEVCGQRHSLRIAKEQPFLTGL